MIEAGFVFGGSVNDVVQSFATLPQDLRPTHFSHEESVRDPSDVLEDEARLVAFVKKSRSGFFLLGSGLTYSLRVAEGKSTICDCFLAIESTLATGLLRHVAKVMPSFGFACAPEEREFRNRISVTIGASTVETWVGRDASKYVPGLYWLTLLSEDLAKRHNIPLNVVARVARESEALGGGQHLFRFYDRPDDWSRTPAVSDLCASFPGVFNINEIRRGADGVSSVIALTGLLKNWR